VTELLRIRGREVSRGDLEQIGEWLGLHPEWSRRRLSEELARHWDWRTPTGQLKDIAARDLLNRLESRGPIRLPARQRRGGRQIPRALNSPAQGTLNLVTPVSAPPRSLGQRRPLSWHQAQPERAQVARYLAEHHYLVYVSGAARRAGDQ